MFFNDNFSIRSILISAYYECKYLRHARKTAKYVLLHGFCQETHKECLKYNSHYYPFRNCMFGILSGEVARFELYPHKMLNYKSDGEIEQISLFERDSRLLGLHYLIMAQLAGIEWVKKEELQAIIPIKYDGKTCKFLLRGFFADIDDIIEQWLENASLKQPAMKDEESLCDKVCRNEKICISLMPSDESDSM